MLADGLGEHLVEQRRPPRGPRARRPAAGSCRGGCRPAGSGGPSPRRSSSSSSRSASVVHSTSSCSRLVADALIAASGVRRSCETLERMLARSSLTAASPSALATSASSSLVLDGRRQLPGEGLQHAHVLARARRRRRRDEDVLRVDLHDELRVVRRRWRGAARRLDLPPSSARWSSAAPSKPKARRSPSSIGRGAGLPASRIASPPWRARASPGPRAGRPERRSCSSRPRRRGTR